MSDLVITAKYLLENGVHFGHQTRRWNPKMAKYIHSQRNGVYIINLKKTLEQLQSAYNLVNKITKEGGRILFVCTKKQATDIVKQEADRCSMFSVTQRWLGGTLTNFKTIRKSINKLHNISKMEDTGEINKYPKKEILKIQQEKQRLEKFLGGIKNMKRTPQAIFVVDPKEEKNAILEARKLNIPCIGIVDTNCDPELLDIPIPANDDGLKSIRLILNCMAHAVLENGGGEKIQFSFEDCDIQSDTQRVEKIDQYTKQRPKNNDNNRNGQNHNNKGNKQNKFYKKFYSKVEEK